MRIVLTYDVSQDHTPIKQACLRGGFSDCMPVQGGYSLRLPNTTLYGEFTSPTAAVTRFSELVQSASRLAKIEKVFAMSYDTGYLDSDERC